MNSYSCPCCSDQLLRHIRHNQVYWFCRSCWQEMPLLDAKKSIVSDTFPRNSLLPMNSVRKQLHAVTV